MIVALTEPVTNTIDSPTVRDYDILAAAEILGGVKVYGGWQRETPHDFGQNRRTR